jgi:hypothetical protein
MTHPAAVTAWNLYLEYFFTDSNRSIATLAITTLLKTGGEASVDQLMKQIASFLSEISDEFKICLDLLKKIWYLPLYNLKNFNRWWSLKLFDRWDWSIRASTVH